MSSGYELSTKKTYAETLEALETSFNRWGVKEWFVRPMRTDGRKNWYPKAEDRRVVVRYLHPSGRTVELSMDKQSRPEDNLRVLFMCIDAVRMNETRGLGDVMSEQYLQLAAPKSKRDPYEVLGVRPDAPPEIVEAAYRAAAKKAHPDAGGSDEAMAAVNDAYEAVRKAG